MASALINSTQQIGGSLGTALLNTIAATATASYLVSHGSGASAVAAGTLHGFSVAFIVAAAFIGVALVAVLVLITANVTSSPDGGLPGEIIAGEAPAEGLSGDRSEGDEVVSGLVPAWEAASG